MAGKGHNIAHARLRGFFDRIERLNEEIDALNADKSEVYAEAKGEGFDVKVMRVVLSRRQMDREEIEARDALIELYESVLTASNGNGTKRATRARAKDAEDDDE